MRVVDKPHASDAALLEYLDTRFNVRRACGRAIYCHFTYDAEAGPFQWLGRRFFLRWDGGPDVLHIWAPQGAPFLLVALHKLRH
jgi:hypothetical protein